MMQEAEAMGLTFISVAKVAMFFLIIDISV
jgi:hypothetical protein